MGKHGVVADGGTKAHGPPDALCARRTPEGRPGGRVILVGGGPGAADLITVRGLRALAQADVVVTDRLGPTDLLGDLPPEVEVVDVGKVPGRHTTSQDEINRTIVEQALRGRTVVRLKGGDPFLFGRGGEEVQACRANGIPVEVVPGVSSAVAVPAAAGIPVTHRGAASALLVAHGHDRLPRDTLGPVVAGTATLALLMAVSMLPTHVADLLGAGVEPSTPVAVIENGTLPGQRVIRCTLDTLVAEAETRGVRSPAVVVIGAVADATLLGIRGGAAVA